MSSENSTDTNTDKTTTQPETPQKSDNKVIFRPLGKYAAVAVIMVSLIVTTAIMLNDQLDTVNQQIASIEEEVSSMNAATEITTDTDTHQTETAVTNTESVDDEITDAGITQTDNDVTGTDDAETIQAQLDTKALAKETESDTTAETSEAQTESIKLTVIKASPSEQPTEPAESVAQLNAEHKDTDFENRRAQIKTHDHATLENYKAEQKKRMTEMFARIQKLEQQQLDKYKASQDQRIENLRQQNIYQQQVIEALILRNEEAVKVRETNLKKNQVSREQLLNRI